MPRKTITLTVTVDVDEWKDFRVEHFLAHKADLEARNTSIVASFDARMGEVFGPNGSVLTGASVVAVDEDPVDVDAFRGQVDWMVANRYFKLNFLQETDPWGDLSRAQQERLFGGVESLNEAMRELMFLRFPDIAEQYRRRDREATP